MPRFEQVIYMEQGGLTLPDRSYYLDPAKV
jgi:predicted metalloendopeptidase